MCLRNHAVVAHVDETWNWIDLITMTFHERCHHGYMSLYNPNMCHHVNGIFTYSIQSSMPFALLHPIPRQTFDFTSVTGESLDGPFGLWDWEFDVRFSEQVEMWTHLTIAHMSTVFWLSEMSSGPENPVASLHRIDAYFSPCVTEIQFAFIDAVASCGKWQWLSEVLLSTWLYLTPQHDGF